MLSPRRPDKTDDSPDVCGRKWTYSSLDNSLGRGVLGPALFAAIIVAITMLLGAVGMWLLKS
jgi:hypothetical protein